MTRNDIPDKQIEVQLLLDRHFRKILALVEEHSTLIRKEMTGLGSGLEEIDERRALGLLSPLVNAVYREMAYALFYAVPLLQDDPLKNEAPGIDEPLNFYFWPGYQSRSLKNQPRLYYLDKVDESYPDVMAKVGVGICGDPRHGGNNQPELYYQCCQARWYHYATTHPNRPMKHPGSVYQWFAQRQPRLSEDPHDLLYSLSVRVQEDVVGDQEPVPAQVPFHVVGLDPPRTAEDTIRWGHRLALRINELSRSIITYHPELEFPDSAPRPAQSRSDNPDRTDRRTADADQREVRRLLISLWMHSVFCPLPPDELKRRVIQELEKVGLREVGDWIRRAELDHYANDWGDGRVEPKRPLFREWTTISLHPAIGQQIDDKTLQFEPIGSAIILSSVPLPPRYIAAVRPWIRSVYGLLLDFDVVIKTHNYNVRSAHKGAQGLAMLAGPWVGHEFTNIFEKTFGSVARNMDSCKQEHIALRKLAWDSLRHMAYLSDFVGNAITGSSTRNEEERNEDLRRIRVKFVDPLAEELAVSSERLLDSVYVVAGEVYGHFTNKIRIPDLDQRPTQRGIHELAPKVAGSCLLLLHEIISNSRHAARVDNPDIRFSAALRRERSPASSGWDDKLVISLKANTDIPRRESKSFEHLKRFLETAEVGSARLDWPEPPSRYTYSIEVLIRNEKESHETTQAETTED